MSRGVVLFNWWMLCPSLDWLAEVHVWLKKVALESTNNVLLLAIEPCSLRMLIVASLAVETYCSSGNLRLPIVVSKKLLCIACKGDYCLSLFMIVSLGLRTSLPLTMTPDLFAAIFLIMPSTFEIPSGFLFLRLAKISYDMCLVFSASSASKRLTILDRSLMTSY